MKYTERATLSRPVYLLWGISLSYHSINGPAAAGLLLPPGCFGSNLPSFPLRAPATSEFLLTHAPGYARGTFISLTHMVF